MSADELARGATVLVPSGNPPPVESGGGEHGPVIGASPHAQSYNPPRGSATGDVSSTIDDDVESGEPVVPVRSIPRAAVALGALVAVVGAIFLVAILARGPKPADPNTQTAASATTTSGPGLSLSSKVVDKPCPPGMAAVPGGNFFMSSRGDHVTIAPYCLDITEVTSGAYAECVKKSNCTTDGMNAEPFCTHGTRGRDHHPANCVDWDQSAAYCLAQSKRLPTMAEWEWAARGADKGTTYPWGDEAASEQLCWSGSIKRMGVGTCEVGTHPSGATPFGIQDLAGNVSEWTTGATDDDSVRPLLGDHWSSEHSTFTKDVSGRTSVGAGISARKLHRATVGFRCAMTP